MTTVTHTQVWYKKVTDVMRLSLMQHDVLKSLQSKVAFNVWDNVTYKDNLIKLEVYFEEFNFEEISETPSYVVSRPIHNHLRQSTHFYNGLSKHAKPIGCHVNVIKTNSKLSSLFLDAHRADFLQMPSVIHTYLRRYF